MAFGDNGRPAWTLKPVHQSNCCQGWCGLLFNDRGTEFRQWVESDPVFLAKRRQCQWVLGEAPEPPSTHRSACATVFYFVE